MGNKKQKIWLTDSSRTLLNTKEMLPVKLWFPLVLRNKNKTAEIKLFKAYTKGHRKIAVSFLCRNASAWQSRWSNIASIALRQGKSVFPEIPSIMTFSNRTQNSRRHTFLTLLLHTPADRRFPEHPPDARSSSGFCNFLPNPHGEPSDYHLT